MDKYWFIAEKPSLMRDVQACYRKHTAEINQKVGEIDFIALSGHVCRNCEPDTYDEWEGQKWNEVTYPMVPGNWKVEAIDDSYKRKILANIKANVKNYDGIIVGTDSDVEGYGIYYLLEEYLGIKSKKALRFIEHSLTDAEILKSLLTMTDYHNDPKHIRFTQSYILRSRADWLYGMNGTRMVSVKQDHIMTVGRVKAPTIKLVYDNSMAIDNFKPQKYFQVEADYGSFTSTLMNENGLLAQFTDKLKIPSYPLKGIVKSKKTDRTFEHAPKLFDLAAIQVEAGQKFGYSPSETLDLVQSLYEKHKVISYPRTQCRYVSAEKSKEFPDMLKLMDVFDDLAPCLDNITNDDIQRVMKDKQVVNDAEVQKESHDALLPTSNRPVLSNMTQKEINVCHMIYMRLLSQFLPLACDDKTQLIIQHGEGDFVAKGKMIVEQGWRVLYKTGKDKAIPSLNEGDEITAKIIKPIEKTTTPPKRLTQSTLLAAMENIASQIEDKVLKKSLAESKGIGTPATRDSIIKDIINRKYIEEKKGALYISPLGKQYIECLKQLDIISPVFAAIMDTEIKKIQRGEAEYNTVYKKILEDLRKMCEQINEMKSAAPEIDEVCPLCGEKLTVGRFNYECPNSDCEFKVSRSVCGIEINEQLLHKLLNGEKSDQYTFKKKDGTQFDGKLLIKDGKLGFDISAPESKCSCPKCGAKLTVGKYKYTCSSCDYEVSREIGGNVIDEKMLQNLFDGKATSSMTFKKKDGTSFKAKLVMQDGKLGFDFSSGLKCPNCGKDLKLNRGGAFCDDECGFKLFRKVAGCELTDKDIKDLLVKGKTAKTLSFTSKAGKQFDAFLTLENGQTKFAFPQKNS